MGGRQAHGRPLLAAPKVKAKTNANKGSKARSQKNALDAFGIAQDKFAPRTKKTPRVRELDAEIEKKHGREDDEDDDEDDEDEAPMRKKVKRPTQSTNDDADDGSDSEGNEWRLGGLRDDDEDSEIESDDAFGDSDNEQFQGYSFRGSKPGQKDGDSEDDSQDDEGETLGGEAIDLATALDQWEESEDEPENNGESGSDDSDEDSDEDSEEDSDNDDDSDDEDEDEETNPERLAALQGMIAGYGGEDENDKDKPSSKPKIDLSDLGLANVSDPHMKKALKLISKEEKENRPGQTKRLEIPLSRREQAQQDRAAAYEKTNETLDRWSETVKQNRRAEHLVFPLPQNSATAGLDTTEIQPLSTKNPSNELESAILSIMEQSGLSMEKPQKPKEKVYDEEGNELSRKEVLHRKRMERELNSREAKRAKRIKKIKSKAYHRVHRRQKERDEMAAHEAMEEAGEIDSEAEREAQDRRRALERVGQRHKDSKWAKLGAKNKRAVWDDDFRAGLTEMARKDEELRRRKEGRAGASDDDETSDSGSDSDDPDAKLRRQLRELEEEDDEPKTGLMSMKFMQKAEAAKKQANDDLIKQIQRDLDGEEAEVSDDEATGEVGRRQYGAPNGQPFAAALDTSSRKNKRRKEEDDDDVDMDDVVITTTKPKSKGAGASNGFLSTSATTESSEPSTAGAWSRGETRRKKKGTQGARIEDLDLTSNVIVASRPSKAKSSSAAQHVNDDSEPDSDAEADQHLPMAIRDQEMVARAFAGEDVVGEFEKQKQEIAEEDDGKVIDNTLPGWGSWVGEGVRNKEKKRHEGRFLTKVEGIKKKDRKDSKLDKVIINERRIKKNDRYLASQLPHPYESRAQYERALRLPVGPEWQTKETFQDSTKPRVLMKQGIITPISKPSI